MILKQTWMGPKLHQETGLLLSINTPNIIQSVDGRWQPAVDAKNAILHSSTQANGALKSCSLHYLQLKTTCTAWPLSVQPRLGSQRPLCNIATWQIVKTIWYGKQFWKWYLQRYPFPSEWLDNPKPIIRFFSSLQTRSHIHTAILSQALIVETIDLQGCIELYWVLSHSNLNVSRTLDMQLQLTFYHVLSTASLHMLSWLHPIVKVQNATTHSLTPFWNIKAWVICRLSWLPRIRVIRSG